MPLQNVPSAEGKAWKFENDKLVSALMTKSPAALGVTELTTCQYTIS